MNIKSVSANENGTLDIEADDGRKGVFDVRPYFQFSAFKALGSQKEFNRVRNGGYFIEWDCGADLSADTIEAKLIQN